MSKIDPKFISQLMTTDAELNAALALKQSLAEKNQPNGYAGLDSNGRVLAANLPVTQSSSTVTPAGVISYYPSETAPSGWLICDGSAVSRSVYADLFSAIGTRFGDGDSLTTFNLPNASGVYIRGSGIQSFSGKTYSATFGAKQTDLFKTHKHRMAPGTGNTTANTSNTPRRYPDISNGVQANFAVYTDTPVDSSTANGNNSPTADGGAETRPASLVLTTIIKF